MSIYGQQIGIMQQVAAPQQGKGRGVTVVGRRMQHVAPRVIADVAAPPRGSDGVTRGAHQGTLGVGFGGRCPSSRWATILPTNQVDNGVQMTRMAKKRQHCIVLGLSNGSGMQHSRVLRQRGRGRCFVFHTVLCVLLHVVFGGQYNFTVNGTVFQPIGQRLESGFSPWRIGRAFTPHGPLAQPLQFGRAAPLQRCAEQRTDSMRFGGVGAVWFDDLFQGPGGASMFRGAFVCFVQCRNGFKVI